MNLLTVQQTARLLKISPITVRRYIASGRLPVLAIRGAPRVRREALKRLTAPVPEQTARPRAPRLGARRVTDDWLADLIGIAGTDDEAPSDVSSNKHAYLVESCSPGRVKTSARPGTATP